MEFKKKTVEEINAMTADEQKNYIVAKENHDKEVRKTEIEAATKELKENVEKTGNTVDEIKEEITSLKEEIKSSNSYGWDDVSSVVEKHITDNHEKIKSAFKSRGTFELSEEIMKAVGMVTTANGTLPTALPVNYVAQTAGVPNVRLRRPNLLDYVNMYSTNQKSLPYIEAVPGEGDFAIVAEGGVKPQLDIDWATRYAEPQKFAGWIKVTEEAIEDIPRLRDLIINYLKDKHDLFKEATVYTYIAANSTTFVTGGALSGSVTMPTIMDVVNAMQLQIINTPNYTVEPDFFGDVVLMNAADFYKYFGAAKDAFGRP